MFTILCTTVEGLRSVLANLEDRRIDAKMVGQDAVLVRVFD